MLKKISLYLFRSPDEIGFDNFLVLILSFMTAVLGTFGTLINIILNLGLELIAATFIPTIVFIPVYLYCRARGKYTTTKFIVSILALLVLDTQWFLNFGSHGPILYLFVVLECFIIIFFKNWQRLLFIFLVFANLSILFYIEYNYPEVVGNYASDSVRIFDLYLGMVLYLIICYLLISMAFGFYTKEQEKAQNADKLKSAFLANMSHEIRTPMNGILGFAELLKEPGLSGEDQQRYIEIIEDSGARMLAIINDIVDISKIEAGLMQINLNEANINDQLDFIDAFFKPEIDEKGLRLTINKPENLKDGLIKTDHEKIYAVIINLVKNAVKFTPTGTIEMGYTRSGRVLEFFVRDSGIGIPEDMRQIIFDRFIQAEASSRRSMRGTGLGLSISKAYVEMLGGRIWVESNPDQGSTFYFTIPHHLHPTG